MRAFYRNSWGNQKREVEALEDEMPRITEFERLVEELELQPLQYESSPELKDWVRRNKDQKYVPTGLLKAWGFRVLAEV